MILLAIDALTLVAAPCVPIDHGGRCGPILALPGAIGFFIQLPAFAIVGQFNPSSNVVGIALSFLITFLLFIVVSDLFLRARRALNTAMRRMVHPKGE